MTTKLVKWASNDDQIIKSGLSDGRGAIFLPSVAECTYEWLRNDGYLGNVGLLADSKRPWLVIADWELIRELHLEREHDMKPNACG